jgi:ABC-2 type transport system ATP-binding protein
MAVISTHGLTKRFGALTALKGVDLDVDAGTIFGLIGPDSAGKTTLMRILVGVMTFDGGTATVLGCDMRRERERVKPFIGYMSQSFSLYMDLTAKENLLFFAQLFGTPLPEALDRMPKLLEFSHLTDFVDFRAAALSGGMKQKLALAACLIHRPKILFLDEPTNGVDVVARAEFWNILRGLKADGITIFVSTTYMDEADYCDRLGYLRAGEMRAVASPEEIRRMFTRRVYKVYAADPSRVRPVIEALPGTVGANFFGEVLHVDSNAPAEEMSRCLANIERETGVTIAWEEVVPTLEDVIVGLDRE